MTSKTESDLAVNGGTPVRSKPFPPWPTVTDEEKAAVLQVLDSNVVNYHRGTRGYEFERAFADFVGTAYAVCCNSGTSALHMAMAAAGCGPGDEVIAPVFTFQASALAALLANAVPVLVDVDPDLPTLSPDAFAEAVTPRTRAVVAVHLYGHPCRMDEILAVARENGVAVIEDCAQCHGAEYHGRVTGSVGDVNAFSFCQTKTMTTGGEGGMVTTSDPDLAAKAASVRDFGAALKAPDGPGRYRGTSGTRTIGLNYRMTEMQSAMGCVLTGKLPAYVRKRRELRAELKSRLADCGAVRILDERPGSVCSPYAAFAMTEPEALRVSRDQFVAAVSAELTFAGGVAVRTGAYPAITELDQLAAHSGYGGKPCPTECPWIDTARDRTAREFANADRFRQRCMVFEVHPTIDADDVADVVEAVTKVGRAYAT